jgi:hypothetical protein
VGTRRNSRNKVKSRPRHHQPLPTSRSSRDKGQRQGSGVYTVRIQTLKPPHIKIGVIPCKKFFAIINNTENQQQNPGHQPTRPNYHQDPPTNTQDTWDWSIDSQDKGLNTTP